VQTWSQNACTQAGSTPGSVHAQLALPAKDGICTGHQSAPASSQHRPAVISHLDAAMSLDAHGSGKIHFSTPVRIVTASLCIQPQNGLKLQDDKLTADANGRLSNMFPAEQCEPAGHKQGMPPSGRAKVPVAAGMQEVLAGSARGRPRSGRPQRAAAKPAPVSDLDSEEDEDYEVCRKVWSCIMRMIKTPLLSASAASAAHS